MKIVFANPPVTVYDKTLHYFQATFSATAGYLARRFPEAELLVEPAGLTGATQRSIVRHLASARRVDFLILWVRVWEAPAALELARLARQLCPEVKILVWGDALVYLPHYFQREPFDLTVSGGDAELVLADAVENWSKGQAPGHGVAVRGPAGWGHTPAGRTLDPIEWPFPVPAYIDPQGYHLARQQRGKRTDDLSFTISRGCPVNCAAWCPTPRKEGLVDRRRPARQTVEYMARGCEPYELFQLHSPLFAQDRVWLREFVERKSRLCPGVPFKSVDLVSSYRDERLVAELAGVGLRGVGFGVETLAAGTRQALTRKVNEAMLIEVGRLFARYGLEAKAYTQLGLPGQTRADILYTHRFLLDQGFTVRATGATPFARLLRLSVDELDALDLSRWDRKSFYDPRCGLSQAEFFRMILNVEEAPWAA